MLIIFNNTDGQYVGRWVNVEYAQGGVPNIGDHVILHSGDYNEDADEYVIKFRTYDGTKTNVIYATVDGI